VLRRVFRGKFVAGLKRRFQQGQLTFTGTLQPLQNEKAFRSFLRPFFRQDWVVYAKPPFGGPHHVLGYLARYTHRVAITNPRLVAFERDQVTFRWKDYADGNKKRKMTLSAQEFLRRFLLHVLPRGFVRIRSFGFLANRRRATLLPRCQRLLLDNPKKHAPTVTASSPTQPACFRCPKCAAPMLIVERLSAFTASQLAMRSTAFDSS
jgi:Putative transposase